MTLRQLFTSRRVILFALAAMIVLSFISYWSLMKLNQLTGEVDHTHVVQLHILKTYTALSDADSEHKAFLITRDSSYYLSLLREETTIINTVSSLKHLTKDNPAQQKRIATLDSLIQVRWAYMSAILTKDETYYEFYAAKIDHCNQLLKEQIDLLESHEENLLHARMNNSTEYQSSAPFSLLTIQVSIVVCLLIGFVLVTSDLKVKEKLQTALIKNNTELKDQRDFTQSIFENTVDVVLIFDHDLRIIALNKRARELYDPYDNAVGKNVIELYPQSKGSRAIQAIADATRGIHTHLQAQESLVYSDVYYDSFYVPLTSGEKIIGAMAIHHDVSDSIKMASDVQQMNDQLMKSNQELEQFAYVASHDLQEPLRKIRIFSSLASHQLKQDDGVKKYLDRVMASAERMSILIGDILNYSRISNRKNIFAEVDLNVVLAQVLEDFELLIEEKEAVIHADSLPIVFGSHQQLTQVVSNIINNSLKFCHQTPRIEIRARLIDDHHEIRFTDNGIGFEQEYAEQIFGVFTRLNHRSEFAGTGIGLALCKKIIEGHDGLINADSKLGSGTIICIILPQRIVEKDELSVELLQA